MSRNRDREIEKLFQALKIEDAEQAPSFRETLQYRKLNSSEESFWRSFWLKPAVVAMLLMIVLVPIAYKIIDNPQPESYDVVQDLASWESPTDFLLSFNEDDFLSEVPKIEAEIWTYEEISGQDE